MIKDIEILELKQPPCNITINIKGNKVKCIKYKDITYVNIVDLSGLKKYDIQDIVVRNKDLKKYIIEMRYYGSVDYYIEGTIGVESINKAMRSSNLWY